MRHRVHFGCKAAALLFLWACSEEPLATTEDQAFASGAAPGKVVFASTMSGTQDIYISNGEVAAGDVLKHLVNGSATSVQADPVLSPDGKYVAYVSDIQSNFDVYIVTADGVSAWKVTSLAGTQSRPVFSPDGKRLAFASDHTGNVEIFAIDIGGTGLTQLTIDPGEDVPGSWGRSGIYFESTRSGDREIYRMNPDGAAVTRLTSSPGDDARPRISPKGKQVLFESMRDGNLELYVSNDDGTNPVRLTNRPSREFMGAWSPNGRQIIFVSDYHGPTTSADLWTMNSDGSGIASTAAFFGDESSPSWSR